MLIAHIGRGKCGSTSLQYALKSHRLQLLEQGIYVPETEVAHAGHHVSLWRDLTGDVDPALALWDVAKSVRDSAYISTVVSSEFFLHLPAQALGKLVDAVYPDKIRAIVYLRDYVSWLPSVYSQRVRTGRLEQDIDWYFDRAIASFVSVVPQIRLWARSIGAENVSIGQLQNGMVDGRSISEDFALQIGNIAERERRNETPHWWATEFRRAIMKILPSPDRITAQQVAFAMRQFDARARDCGVGNIGYLTEEQCNRLSALYLSDMQVLRNLLGHPEGARFSRRPVPRKGLEPPSLSAVPSRDIAKVAATCANRFGHDSAVVQVFETILNSRGAQGGRGRYGD